MIEGWDRDETIHYPTTILDEFNANILVSKNIRHLWERKYETLPKFQRMLWIAIDFRISIGTPFVLLLNHAYYALDIGKERLRDDREHIHLPIATFGRIHREFLIFILAQV